MQHYRIADLSIEMECRSHILLKQAEPYQTESGGLADRVIQIAEERLISAVRTYPHLSRNECEYILTGCDFYGELLDFNGFGLHASAVALEKRAVLFSGPCGTGKSTHAGLWQQYFGTDKAIIINDDKPALRLMKGTIYACGTPWSGKSSLNANIRVPLGAVVFLKQAKENRIRHLSNKEAVRMLIYQSLRPNSAVDKMSKLLTLLDTLLVKTPVYQLECTIGLEAVELAYHAICSERIG